MKLEHIMQKVPQWAGQPFSVTPLDGGKTNQTYKVVVDGAAYVVRIGAQNTHLHGIQRSTEYQLMSVAAQAGITPEVIAIFPEEDVSISRFIDGRLLNERDIHQPQTIKQIVHIMKRYHALPVCGRPIRFFEIGHYYAEVKDDPLISHEITEILQLGRLLKSALTPCQGAPVICHNDLAPVNFMDDGKQLWLFDWEYAGAGDCFLDLANLSSDNDFSDAENDVLLRHYFGKYTPAMWAKFKLMRTWSDLREAMWALVQRQTATVDLGYTEHACRYLNRFRQACQSPQLEQWLTKAVSLLLTTQESLMGKLAHAAKGR